MQEMIKKVEELLTTKRFEHVLEVVKMAKQLARVHGINSQKAEIAAYLHDVSKFFDLEDMKEYVKKNSLVNTYSLGELLHGFAGAIYSRNRFNIEDMDILNAIRYHTIGRSGMSDLEKLIYIADAVEETRKYPYVEEIRAMAFESLDKAMLMETDRKMEYLIKQHAIIHPSTVEMRNWLIERLKKQGEING